jgi:ribosomal protein S18 acetylase RimI-like enzyme
LTSTGYRTDIALRALEGSQVTEYADCVVVRSPANPGFRWGNFVLLREPPRPGAARHWTALFRREFPQADYTALGVDVTAASEVAADEFLAAGLRRSVDSVLTATSVRVPPHVNGDADYRPLATDEDWSQAAALSSACFPGGPADQEFMRLRMSARRRLTEDGHGAWFGAFRRERLSAQLGIFITAGGVARFQDVETHPDARRQGLAGSLVYAAARHGLDGLAARTLVMVADPDGDAIRLYRSLGFTDREEVVGLELLAAPTGLPRRGHVVGGRARACRRRGACTPARQENRDDEPGQRDDEHDELRDGERPPRGQLDRHEDRADQRGAQRGAQVGDAA